MKRLIALMAILATLVAACGGSEEGSDSASISTTTGVEMTDTTIVGVAVDAGFDTLVDAVQAAALVDTLQGDGPFTVFAPTDEAFAALPDGVLDALLADPVALADVLTYHVVAGSVLAADVVGLDSATTVEGEDIAIAVDSGTVTLNGSANVLTTDVMASNGIIHVIDRVLLPPSMSETAPEGAMAGDIIATATDAGSFTTLLAAIDVAGLTETLQGAGPFTVFAPTDEAFAALGDDTIAALLEDPEALAQILLYHVVAGEVLAADVVELDSATSVAGEDITITIDNGSVILNGSATVLTTDIEASNGVIHVIDAVILPPAAS